MAPERYRIVSRHYLRRTARAREHREEHDQMALAGHSADKGRFQTIPAKRGPARYWVVERLS